MSTSPFRLSFFANAETSRESNDLQIYFKGERGLTQTSIISLINGFNEKNVELFDVGNLIVAHLQIEGKIGRWKIENLQLERKIDKEILDFPFQFTFDSKRNRKIDVLINEGPVRLTPIYTITVQTGPISRCSNVDVKIALIGEGASTLPFELFSDEFSNRKEVFQSGSRDRFEISPFETSDVGQLFHIQLECKTHDLSAFYCESVEVTNNLTEKTFFVLVNQWFGNDLEHRILLPVIDRSETTIFYTISVKTSRVSISSGEKKIEIQIVFNNGNIYTEELFQSETNKNPFEKDQIDFFTLSIDEKTQSEIVDVKIRLGKTFPSGGQWQCSWIEIRDLFYQRNSYFFLRNPLENDVEGRMNSFVSLERLVDLPLKTT